MIEFKVTVEDKVGGVTVSTICNVSKDVNLGEMSALIYQLEYMKAKLLEREFNVDFESGGL